MLLKRRLGLMINDLIYVRQYIKYFRCVFNIIKICKRSTSKYLVPSSSFIEYEISEILQLEKWIFDQLNITTEESQKNEVAS